ncbi:MAG: caspase family protein [Phaeodactylibacter sp.]|nr:caspase family protein [Phaeodactylibacter sp.]MCB9300458.1 caspase family protein [Lewinellaceae bacterium]
MLLAIGVDRYQHISGLHNAVRDVDYLIEVLNCRYQFDKKWTIKLVNEAATLGNISQKFHHLVEEAKAEDEVLIYFSGHGSFNRAIDRGYWIPYDGKPDETHTLFSNGALVDFIASIQAKHVVLMVDSCFSGAFFGGVRKFDLPERLGSIPSRWVLTSGRNEVVSDGAPGQNSPFAESLIFHLNANEETSFRITELFPRIIEQVGANTEQLPQCEPIRNVGHKGGEFIFRLRGVPTEHLALPLNYQSAVTPPPQAPSARFNWKIAVSILAVLITILVIWRIITLMPYQPAKAQSWRKDYYERIQSIEQGFIVSKNGLFGYAKKDTTDWILPVYQEAYAFTEGLARVKRDGRYGWVDTTGKEAIPFQYSKANDFQDGSAQVSLDGSSFYIGLDGKKIVEAVKPSDNIETDTRNRSQNTNDQATSPAPPRLLAGQEVIDLGIMELGALKEFSLSFRNTGGTTAVALRTESNNGIEVLSGGSFSLEAGKSKKLPCRLKTSNLPLGNYSGIIKVGGNNVSRAIEVAVTGRVVAPSPPPVTAPTESMLSAQCYLGPPGCQVSFYDRLQKKNVAFLTDLNGYAQYTISEGLVGETVEVRYCGSTSSLTVRVKEGGCISLPQ